jgi:hypothetical protein
VKKFIAISILALSTMSAFAVPQPDPSQGAIHGTVRGEFKGWDGHTVIELTNGQVWIQTEYDYDYEYEFQPDVLFYYDGCWKAKVGDETDVVCMRRIQ